jgi:O-antigen/teichoic acid export membrane protein
MSILAPKLADVSTPAYRGFLLVNAVVFAAATSALLVGLTVPLGVMLRAPWLVTLAIPLAVANALSNFADYVRRYHFVYEAPALAFSVDGVRYAVQLGVLLLLGKALPGHLTAGAALYSLGAGGLAATVLGMARYGDTRWVRRLSAAIWPRHLNFIRWLTPSVMLDTILGSAPLFIAQSLLGETALGLARAMQSLANVLNLPLNAVLQVAPSMATAELVRGGQRALRRFLLRMTAWNVGALLLISATVVAFSQFAFGTVFHLDAAAARPIVLLYCLVNVVVILRLPLIIGFQAVERPHVMAMANALGCAASIALSPFAIRAAGAAGIPIATAVAVFITGVTYLAAAVIPRPRRGLASGVPSLARGQR